MTVTEAESRSEFELTKSHDISPSYVSYAVYVHDDLIKWKPRYWPFVQGFHRSLGIPHTKASDTELLCFLSSVPEPTVEKTMETPVIWDAIALNMMSL